MSSYAPLYVFKYVRTLPGNQRGDLRILGEQSNQAAEFIRNAMSVGSFLARKSDKERLTMDDAQKRGECGRMRRRRRREGERYTSLGLARQTG